ncbi:G-protein coupled receptor GRL101-like protein [Trichoplax sp. H2]|nr:G-protein coupled receptor GRL101-like protein [Trichoplax sp. H2]|eukprot:RDD36329.1 G-protein coupled receptor GRL101-like protein [Trichoplax sp. H2]
MAILNSSPSRILCWTCGSLGILFNILVVVINCQNLRKRKINSRIASTIKIQFERNRSLAISMSKKINNQCKLGQVAATLFLSLSLADMLSSIYLLVLCIADIGVGATYNQTFARTSVSYNFTFSHSHRRWARSFPCTVLRFISITGATASCQTTLLITLDRYVALVYPLKFQLKCNFKRALLFCVLIWFTSCILGAIACYITDVTMKNVSIVNWYRDLCLIDDISNSDVQIYIFLSGCSAVIIYGATSIVYIAIGYNLRKTGYFGKIRAIIQSSKSNSTKIDRGVILTTGLITITNILCWMPVTVISFGYTLGYDGYKNEKFAPFGVFITLLFPANCLFNPMIFLILYWYPTFLRYSNT